MLKVLSFVGKSGVGKTTIIEKAVKILTKRGYTVGIIKHTVHKIKMDSQESDSYKFRDAGAVSVSVSSPDEFSVIKSVKKEMQLDELIATYMNGCDFIFTEGFKSEKKPKVEVHRNSISKKTICKGPSDGLVAFVSDDDIELKVPRFKFSEVSALVNFIERNFKNDKKNRNVIILAGGKNVAINEFVSDIIEANVMGILKLLKNIDLDGDIKIFISEKNGKNR